MNKSNAVTTISSSINNNKSSSERTSEKEELDPHTRRLLRLIQEGTVEHARHAAALLGQLTSKSSPIKLWDILGRIYQFIIHPSSSWSTRENAALAIYCVAKNIPPGDQIQFLSEQENKNDGKVSDINENKNELLWLTVADLVLASDDMNKEGNDPVHPYDVILQKGRLLLSSSGTQYDFFDDADEYKKENSILRLLDQKNLRQNSSDDSQTETGNEKNNKEEEEEEETFLSKRVKLQRNILAKRLGLGFLQSSNSTKNEKSMEEFITDNDLILPTKKTQKKGSIRQISIERLQQKRMKSTLDENEDHNKEDEYQSSSSIIRKLLVLEMQKSKRKKNMSSSSTASSHLNPQTLLATDCIFHMFDPNWGVRHGAFLGTLSLLRSWKLHKILRKKSSSLLSTFGRWPNDILARSLCVLGLDRFADFAGGTIFKETAQEGEKHLLMESGGIISTGMVAPVRESAAQLLSLVLVASPPDVVEMTWGVLLKMVKCESSWEVRHSALLCMKYIAADNDITNSSIFSGSEDTPNNILNEMKNTSILCLSDISDNVRGVSAMVIRSLLPKVSALENGQKDIEELIKASAKPLWNGVRSVHSVSSCAVDLIGLFSDFVQHDCMLILECIVPTHKTNSIPYSKKSNTQETSHSIFECMEQVMQKLIQFVDFDSVSVQISSLYTLAKVVEPISSYIITNTTSNSMDDEYNDRMFALLCALIVKLFESFFDSSVISISDIGDSKPNEHQQVNKLKDARIYVWNMVVECLSIYCSASSQCSTTSSDTKNTIIVNSKQKSLSWLVTTLCLRLLGIRCQKKTTLPTKNNCKRKRTAETPQSSSISEGEKDNRNTPILHTERMKKLNSDDFFHCQNLAARAFISLTFKISNLFINKNESSTITSNANDSISFLAGSLIELLVQSPWCPIAQGGCILFNSLSQLLFEQEEQNEFVHSIISAMESSHKQLTAMTTKVPVCIKVNSEPEANVLAEDIVVIDKCDQSLAYFMNNNGSSPHDLIEEWKHIFQSKGLPSVEILDFRPATNSASEDTKKYPATINSMRFASNVAGAVISSRSLPPKLTPLIRALMTSIKNETSRVYQVQTSQYMIGLINLLSLEENSSFLKVRDKILGNLCALCCTKDEGVEGNPSAIFVIKQLIIELSSLSPDTFSIESLTPMWSRLSPLSSSNPAESGDLVLLNALQILCVISEALKPKTYALKRMITLLLPTVTLLACSSPFSFSRSLSIKITTNFSKRNSHDSISHILPTLFPALHDLDNDATRYGACHLLHSIVDCVGLGICPFVKILLPVSMSMMTDRVEDCAKTSASTFASLVKVAPLVVKSSDNEPSREIFQEVDSVSVNTDVSQKVIDHLIHGKPLPPCIIPKELSNALTKNGISLRDYQKDGISWLDFLQSVKLNGALCDDMGLGKTLQSLIGIALAHCRKLQSIKGGDSNKTLAKNTDTNVSTHKKTQIKSLIVCPSTLVGHWTNEISKFFSNDKDSFFKVLRYDGQSSKRKVTWSKQIKQANIIVTNYSVMRQDISVLSKRLWTFCVLDEGHLLKNPKTATARAARSLRSYHKLILTGTPIQNRVNELWAIFDFLMPNFLGTEKVFVREYAKPIANGQVPGASADSIMCGLEKLKALHQQVLPFVLRREKGQVLSELPPKNISVIPCPMSRDQAALYYGANTTNCDNDNDENKKSKVEEEVRKAIENLLSNKTNDSNNSSSASSRAAAGTPFLGKDVLQKLLYLRLVCTHPTLVLQNNNQGLEEESDKYLKLDCSGKLAVLNDLMRHAGIYGDEICAADNDHSSLYIEDPTSTEETSKVSNSEDILDVNIDDSLVSDDDDDDEFDNDDYKSQRHRKREGTNSTVRKCLIFAQYIRSLDIVEKYLFQPLMPSLRYLRLDSQVPPSKREEMVNKFNQDKSIKAMLLTTRVGGLGLNLTGNGCCDTVIFLELDWNPQVDLQAMDRAHRIGQQRTLNVYKLVTSESIEEKILYVQDVKMKMAQEIVNSDNSTMYSMGTENLLDIFTTQEHKNKEKSDKRGNDKKEKSNSNVLLGSNDLAEEGNDNYTMWAEDEYASLLFCTNNKDK